MTVHEKTIEWYLHDQVVKAGGWTYKFTSPARRNVPDRLVIWPPTARHELRIEFVELKAPGKEPRPGQVREHERLRRFGCSVFVLDSKDAVREYVFWRAGSNG